MIESPAAWERRLQHWWDHVTGGPPPLSIVDTRIPGLFTVNPFSGVRISTDQAEGIAYFANISVTQFLRICAALGLTQWRALDRNPVLVVEDFAHVEPGECLFARRARRSEYALAFDLPCVCTGCFEFYHCLGADREIGAVAELLRPLHKTTARCPVPAPVLR